MQVPLRVTFRGMEPSSALDQRIREKAACLEQFCDDITACHVIVEEQHRHHHQGRLFHVRIDLSVPGTVLIVDRDPQEHHAHQDVYVAIRDAFDAGRRQLEDYVRERRDGQRSAQTRSR
jgi:ribosome-associated translation inhibitor RaiA